MKRWIVLMLSAAMVLSLAAFAGASTHRSSRGAAGARFDVDGTVTAMGAGYLQVSVTKVIRGSKFVKVGESIRVAEVRGMQVWQGRARATDAALKVGETIEVIGREAGTGTAAVFTATSIKIMK